MQEPDEIKYEQTGETVIMRTDRDGEWVESDRVVDVEEWL